MIQVQRHATEIEGGTWDKLCFATNFSKFTPFLTFYCLRIEFKPYIGCLV